MLIFYLDRNTMNAAIFGCLSVRLFLVVASHLGKPLARAVSRQGADVTGGSPPPDRVGVTAELGRAGPDSPGRRGTLALETGHPELRSEDHGGQLMFVEQTANALAGGEDPHALPFHQLGMPDAHSDEIAVARKSPPPDRPCSGIFSVIKNGRALPLLLSSNVTVSTNREFQWVSFFPRSIPIEVTTALGGGSSLSWVSRATYGNAVIFSMRTIARSAAVSTDREVGRDHARPDAWRCRPSLHAEIVAVQLDEDRSFSLHHVRRPSRPGSRRRPRR